MRPLAAATNANSTHSTAIEIMVRGVFDGSATWQYDSE